MLRDRPLNLGDLRGVIYDFEETGDILDRHVHTATDVHISVVARGSFRVIGDDFDQTVECGAVLDWQPGVYHAFVSLVPRSRLVNIIKVFVR